MRSIPGRSALWTGLTLLVAGGAAWGQGVSQPEALVVVRAAVASELSNAKTDHSTWMYRDEDDTPGRLATYRTIETRGGDLRRLVALDGRPLSAAEDAAERARILKYVRDQGEQSKAHKNAAHDSNQAEELLTMLPEAFVWTLESQNAEAVTLRFVPDPKFSPPDMQGRVMGQMAGEMVVARQGNRIQTLKGRLTQDVLIGFGILGRLNGGGTFDIERRPVDGSHWQITETHVHIGGHALLFKTIGQQNDEVKTEWRASGMQTLAEAAKALGVQ